ncbi:MAG: hypothetical protein R3255_10065 [Candidatus Lokiarchaeia archaeon]|nr:hypothetical protein [Candidatus Lokiarchaeia archaeon]
MNEKQNEEIDDLSEEENQLEEDDLEAYLRDMKTLETDFSDMEDLDFDELQEIQEAIEKVKESEELHDDSIVSKEIISKERLVEEIKSQEEVKESMISDFSDMDEIDFDELREMQEAIESVKHDELQEVAKAEGEIQYDQAVSKELEDRIKQELLKRKKIEKKEVITPEKFLDYIKNKRDKIWYHALYYLTMNVEDNIASKTLLYDVLKEVTSKSPIDPIPEHQFYFGLGYILRLTLNERQVVRFLRDGKFKINVNVDTLKEILEQAGEPISTRPIIKEEEKKKMFKEFLEGDFLKDI